MEFLGNKKTNMDRKSIGGIIEISVLIVVALNNAIGIYFDRGPLIHYFLYVFPFLAAILPVYIAARNKMTVRFNGYLYGFLGILITMLGDYGNTTGVVFWCFSSYIFCNYKSGMIIGSLIVVGIIVKSAIYGYSPTQVVNILTVYGYVYLKYYDMIHPKKPKVENNLNLDETNVEILQFLIMGYTVKQIGERLDYQVLSYDAVNKRISRMRKLFDAKTNEQLIYKAIAKGLLSHKKDI